MHANTNVSFVPSSVLFAGRLMHADADIIIINNSGRTHV